MQLRGGRGVVGDSLHDKRAKPCGYASAQQAFKPRLVGFGCDAGEQASAGEIDLGIQDALAIDAWLALGIGDDVSCPPAQAERT
jgi:hypothetical protein